MAIIRLQDKIPEVYTNTSRDFQLLTRLYDIIINGFKYDTESILTTVNNEYCSNRLMQLLQTKLGFFSDKYITDDDLRLILKAFPTIIKNKGSKLGIEQAVRIFFRICGLDKRINVTVVNNSKVMKDSYIIYIDLYEEMDTTILDEILKYIIPAGCIVRYRLVTRLDDLITDLEEKIGINILVIRDSLNAQLRGNYIQYLNEDEDSLIGSIGLTDVAVEYNPEYRGTITYNYDESIDYNDIEDLLNNSLEIEKIRGYVYIVVCKKTGQIDPNNWVYIPYIYDYIYNDLAWVNMQHQDFGYDPPYNIFSEVVYAYYNNGNIYNTKLPAEFIRYESSTPIALPDEHYLVTVESTSPTYGISSVVYNCKVSNVVQNNPIETLFNPKNVVQNKFESQFDFQVKRNNEVKEFGKINYIGDLYKISFYNATDFQEDIDFSLLPNDIIEYWESYDADIRDTEMDIYWHFNGTAWEFDYNTSTGIEIKLKDDGNLNDYQIISNNKIIATNCFISKTGNIQLVDDQFSTTPTVWIPEYRDGVYNWSNPIIDVDQINIYLRDNNYQKAYITGTPNSACIIAKMYDKNSELAKIVGEYDKNIKLYDNTLKEAWETVEIFIGTSAQYFWTDSEFNRYINVTSSTVGSSDQAILDAYIIPKTNVFIYDGSNYYVCNNENPTYSGLDSNLKHDVLYIDYDTSNAYELDLNGELHQIINYNKINNVYSLDFKDLQELLDNGQIKPAFKNETLIFKDSYGNMLLL